MNTTQPQVSEADGFETLPSKPFDQRMRDEVFRRNTFACPVCSMTGGPTFAGANQVQLLVSYMGVNIPADHAPECLDKAREAFAYWRGQMDDEQMAAYVHTANRKQCSHPKCMAERLWGIS